MSLPTFLKPKAGQKVYYGWLIVAAGFVNQMIAGALLQRSYGAYVALLRRSVRYFTHRLYACLEGQPP